MKWIRIFIAMALSCCSFYAWAADELTPAQLQQLLQAAKQPSQVTSATPSPNTVTHTITTSAPITTTTATATTASPPPVVGAPGTESPTLFNTNKNNLTAPDVGADPRDEAFAGMASTVLPLTPNQIRTLHRLYDANQRAAAEFPGIPPRPTSSSLQVSLAPGSTPPIVRLASGFVTALVFLDRTSAPWPIQDIDLGDPNAFNIQWDKKSNTLLVQALTQYKSANLAVRLQGLNTPVMVTLMPGQNAVDYRVDLHVPGLGPYAVAVSNGLPAPASPLLLNLLSGIPPMGSRSLDIDPPGYAEGWLYQGRLYLRTRATVLSPAWISIMSSSDGTHAYKMPLAPLIIVSQNGKQINLSIEGY